MARSAIVLAAASSAVQLAIAAPAAAAYPSSASSDGLAQAQKGFFDSAAAAILRAREAAAQRKQQNRSAVQAAVQRGDCATAGKLAAGDKEALAYVERTCAAQARQKTALDQVAAFAADPAHPLFEEVRDQMSDLLRAGKALTLQQAYDMAVDSNLDLRGLARAAEDTAAAHPWPVSTEPTLAGHPAFADVKAWTSANVELVGWTPFMDTGTGVLMVQTEPAEASATGVTRLWVRFEFYQPFKYDDLMIRSMREQTELDCAKHASRMLRADVYPYLNLKGPAHVDDHPDQSWKVAGADSPAGQMLKVYCRGAAGAS